MTDSDGYRQGIARLVQCFERADPCCELALAYGRRLIDLGESCALHALDRLSRSQIGAPFEKLCAVQDPSADLDALLDEGCTERIARLWQETCSAPSSEPRS